MAGTPVFAYCWYAPADQMYVHALKKHLASFERQGLLTLWGDQDICPGTDFKKERLSRLTHTDIVLLFTSPDFLASDSCFDAEIQQMLRRRASEDAYIIPILLRPVLWQGMPFCHAQPIPRNGVPITGWSHLDEALLDVAQEISTVLQELLGDQFYWKHGRRSETQSFATSQERKGSQPSFDMRGQSVGKQSNAGRDIHVWTNQK